MFPLGCSSAPRWGLTCPWVSGSAARFALGLKNFSTPLNCDSRAYSIQCLFARRGCNTFMEDRTGQRNFGGFSCFKRGSRNGCDRNAPRSILSRIGTTYSHGRSTATRVASHCLPTRSARIPEYGQRRLFLSQRWKQPKRARAVQLGCRRLLPNPVDGAIFHLESVFQIGGFRSVAILWAALPSSRDMAAQ